MTTPEKEKFRCCRIIANVMTNKGFMNGWCGDTSDEFKLDQANGLFRMEQGTAPYQKTWWREMNDWTLRHHCKIPIHIINTALS